MDPMTLVTNILKVAKTLFGLSNELKQADLARKKLISEMMENISETLANVSSEIRNGNTPHGRCAELIAYAQDLPGLISDDVGDIKAKEIGDTLHSSYDVEGMASSIDSAQDKEPYLTVIEEASGKFRALANMIKIS